MVLFHQNLHQNLRLKAGSTMVLEGVAVGFVLTLIAGVVNVLRAASTLLPAHARRDRIPLGFVLLVVVRESVQELQLAGWLPTTSIGVGFPGFVQRYLVRQFPQRRGARQPSRRRRARSRRLLL